MPRLWAGPYKEGERMEMDSTRFLRDSTIAVIGLGVMGGSFAGRLRQIGAHRIIAYDVNEETLSAALADKVIDAGYAKGNAALAEAALLIFCLPLHDMIEFMKVNRSFFRPGQIVTDIIGIKGGSAEEVEAVLPEYVDYVPGHPMAGREGCGYEMADAAVFEGANYIIVPSKRSGQESIRLIKSLAKALGCGHVSIVTAAEHDRRIAYTSCLPHVLATTLVNSASMNDEMKCFIAGSFRDGTRVADINVPLWTKLLLSDRKSLLTEIEHFRTALSEMENALQNKDEARLYAFLSEAAKRRRRLIHADRNG